MNNWYSHGPLPKGRSAFHVTHMSTLQADKITTRYGLRSEAFYDDAKRNYDICSKCKLPDCMPWSKHCRRHKEDND